MTDQPSLPTGWLSHGVRGAAADAQALGDQVLDMMVNGADGYPLTTAELDTWEAHCRAAAAEHLVPASVQLRIIAAERHRRDRHTHLLHALAGHPLGRSRLMED